MTDAEQATARPQINRRLVLAARPTGMIDDSTVRLEETPLPEPGDGEALLRVRFLSIDPTIRTWMNDGPNYMPPIALDDVVRSAGIGEVVRSRTERFRVGDLVVALTGWQEYALAGAGGADVMQTLPSGIDPIVALNVFGITGMTAYFGMNDVGRVKEDDTVVVSGAAGATGSTAGQIAVIRGAKMVVGIAGTAEKCAWLVDELGFHAAINYKTDDVGARLRDLCPEGIDLYFDNVGGEILNTCLGQLALRGRVVLCGAISSYNSPERPPGPSNYFNLLIKRGRMEGFIVTDYVERFPEAQAEMFGWVADGRMRHKEYIVEGLERAPEALNLLFTGGNTGKVIVRL